jgi:3-dehydroquinate synthase II
MTEKKKEVWVKADADVGAWDVRKARITGSLESGVDVVLIEPEDIAQVRELGRIRIAALVNGAGSSGGADILVFGKRSEGDGTTPIPADFAESHVYNALKESFGKTPTAGYVELRGKAYERFAVALAKQSNYVLVIGRDWKIIPLENIIAELQQKEAKVIAGVQSAEEARTALETLE